MAEKSHRLRAAPRTVLTIERAPRHHGDGAKRRSVTAGNGMLLAVADSQEAYSPVRKFAELEWRRICERRLE